MQMRSRIPARRGFALIAVFWIVIVVGLFAAIVAARTGFDIERSGAAVSMGRARAAADGAAEEAAFQVIGRVSTGLQLVSLADLADFVIQIDGIPVRVSIVDEDSKIDLNSAQPELLAVLLQTVGLSVDDARTLGDHIADFRDEDNLKRAHGAEAAEYREADSVAGPKNAPFDSLDELGQVLGINAEIVAAVMPMLTVYSGRAQFDPDTGPPEHKILADTIEASGLGMMFVPSRRRIFSVTATAELPNGTVFPRRAVFRISGDPRQPVYWLSWVVPARDASSATPSGAGADGRTSLRGLSPALFK